MNLKFKTIAFGLFLFGLLTISQNGLLLANEADTIASNSEQHEKKGGFNPGEVILEHIGDSYSWHIVTFGETHVAIPLPVIVYSKQSGINVFMASKFHHGHAAYNNFEIAKTEPNKGKIVEKLADGTFVRPIDISITKNVLSLLISMGLLLWIFLSIASKYKRNPNSAPKGLQSFVEPVIIFIRDDIAIPSIGKDRYERFMPYLLTVFFFILINNLMGLVPLFPGGANVTGNISITLVLALLTFFITMFSTNVNFWVHIVHTPGVPWWLKFPIPLMPFIEFSSNIIIRFFVLMIRLFANITAGHINVMSFVMLIFIFGTMSPIAGISFAPVSVAFVVFITFIELLVAFIQAYVFTLLSALYFGSAKEKGHH